MSKSSREKVVGLHREVLSLSSQCPHRAAAPSHPACCVCGLNLRSFHSQDAFETLRPFRNFSPGQRFFVQLILSLSLSSESNSQQLPFWSKGLKTFFIMLSQISFVVKGSLSCILSHSSLIVKGSLFLLSISTVLSQVSLKVKGSLSRISISLGSVVSQTSFLDKPPFRDLQKGSFLALNCACTSNWVKTTTLRSLSAFLSLSLSLSCASCTSFCSCSIVTALAGSLACASLAIPFSHSTRRPLVSLALPDS